MYTTDELTEAGRDWSTAAEALLDEAERIGPLEPGIFSELDTDDGNKAAASRIDALVERLIENGDRAFGALEGAALTSVDGRFQATSLMVGSLAVGDALGLADLPPENVFGDLSAGPDSGDTFSQARLKVSEAGRIVTGQNAPPPRPVMLPAPLAENLEKIESAGAKETWALAVSNAGRLAGNMLVRGLDGVLTGTAAAVFDQIRDRLGRWRDALQRGVVRIAGWVVGKVKALLPTAAANQVDTLTKLVQDKIVDRAETLATDVYGELLGRNGVEKRWTEVAATGSAFTVALEKLSPVVTEHLARIGWVTSGRKVLDRFDLVVDGLVGMLPPNLKLAYAALVAAVMIFIAFQVWDGFSDIKALA